MRTACQGSAQVKSHYLAPLEQCLFTRSLVPPHKRVPLQVCLPPFLPERVHASTPKPGSLRFAALPSADQTFFLHVCSEALKLCSVVFFSRYCGPWAKAYSRLIPTRAVRFCDRFSILYSLLNKHDRSELLLVNSSLERVSPIVVLVVTPVLPTHAGLATEGPPAIG